MQDGMFKRRLYYCDLSKSNGLNVRPIDSSVELAEAAIQCLCMKGECHLLISLLPLPQ